MRRARCELRSRPRREAAPKARSSGGEPACQEPVPAESTSTSPSRPSRRSTSSKMPCASGERQILNKQTNRTRTICAYSTSYSPSSTRSPDPSHAASSGSSSRFREPPSCTRVNSLLGTRLGAFPLYILEHPPRLEPGLVELDRPCKNGNSHRLTVDVKDDEPDLVVLA